MGGQTKDLGPTLLLLSTILPICRVDYRDGQQVGGQPKDLGPALQLLIWDGRLESTRLAFDRDSEQQPSPAAVGQALDHSQEGFTETGNFVPHPGLDFVLSASISSFYVEWGWE